MRLLYAVLRFFGTQSNAPKREHARKRLLTIILVRLIWSCTVVINLYRGQSTSSWIGFLLPGIFVRTPSNLL